MALDNVDFDIDGITADGARAIEGAASSEALNQVDIEFLGKRSALTRAHRALGGLDPEARKEAGRRLGEAQAQLKALLAARRAELAESERAEALLADRLDLTEVIADQVRTAPARGPPAPRHPGPGRARGRLRRHGLHRGRGPRGRNGLVQLRGAEHPAGASGPRHVRHHVPRCRRARDGAAAHAHLAGADPPDGGGGPRRLPADPRRHAGQVLPARHARRPPPSRVQPDRGVGGRPGHHLR